MSPAPHSSSQTANPTQDNRPVRGARSCTLCRQMKAKCNATEQYPEPCTRCAHLGKTPCVIEPSFRRVNKRAYFPPSRRLLINSRIAEIQNELEQLKNTVKQRQRSTNSRASSEFSDGPRPPFLAPETANNGAYSPGSSPFPSPYGAPEESFRQLGIASGRIDAKIEDELFMTYSTCHNFTDTSFFQKFHPTLPIVDNTLTPAHTFSICPLLYHTILLLGTLATPSHNLTWPLTQMVNALAPQMTLSPHKSVYLVQAFLLLATWPQTFPQSSNINEQAWMYVSVATHMAQCLGLHKSFLSCEYTMNQTETTEDTRREWVRTWVGCFIVRVHPIILEDFTIQNAPSLLSPTTSSTYDPVLSRLLDKLKIARVGGRITNLLSSCPNSSSGLAEIGDNLAIFRVLQADVQEVEASLLNTDETRGLSFLWLKIQLYSYALHDGMLPTAAKTEFILRGFEASFHFLETFSAANTNGSSVMLLPALHSFSAVCSWMFVLKSLYSRYRMYLEAVATEKALIDAQQVMSSISQTRGDFYSRAAMYMETILQDAKANADQNLGDPYLGIRSRMAAGLYYDGLAYLAHLTEARESSAYNGLETKLVLSPPSIPVSSLTSSPFLSSDDLSTPPATQIPPPPSFAIEKPAFAGINWSQDQQVVVDDNIIPDPSKIDMEWLADSFLTGEAGVTPSDLSDYVAPGLLMAQ